eukprot:6257914-Karenia_brevis.AAC.1
MRLVAFVGSPFDFKGEGHQQGWIIGYTNPFLNKNMKAPMSIALWRSRKLPMKAGSPQFVETYAGSYGAADMSRVRCIFFITMYSDLNILKQCPEHWRPIIRGPTVLRTERQE